MTALQQETIRCELTTVALRLDKLARNSPNHGIRINAAIRLARIRSVLNSFATSDHGMKGR